MIKQPFCNNSNISTPLSFEYFFSKRFSLEAGGRYFWRGTKIYEEDFYQQGMGTEFLGIGPSKGYDIFSDIKYSWKNGTYLGLGYMYRYSYFKNKHMWADVGDTQYQYYNQSETAYSNCVRLTFGAYLKLKNKNIYINPYASLMIGQTQLQLQIDTTGGKPANYSRDVLPINEHETRAKGFLIIGFNFCFDFFRK